jgi:hypothetical protein
MDWKKIGVKALVTFVEALLAALTLIPVDAWTMNGLKLAAAGAVGALLSFIYNTVKEYRTTLK